MKNKQPVRPYYEVRHEYDESMKEYQHAAMMLHNAVRAAIQFAKTPEGALRLLQSLKEHDDKFAKVAFGE